MSNSNKTNWLLGPPLEIQIMNLEAHVIRSIEVFEGNHKQEALMHACMAIDGTTRNLYSLEKATRSHYKKCLRKYFWLIEKFMGGGINLEETKWTNIKIDDGNGKTITNPDLADIISKDGGGGLQRDLCNADVR